MDYFAEDNFSQRRTTGNNMYDPESLLTQGEVEMGLGYMDKRVWPNEHLRLLAIRGMIPVERIPEIAPRMKQRGQWTRLHDLLLDALC